MDIFKDKVAIVTGGASGIGQALCQELGRRGAIIVAADINTTGAEKVAEALSKNGGWARAAHLDVKQADEVQKLINNTAAEHGRVDYMFNNAGISILGEVRDMSAEHWRRIIDINLLGVIYGTTSAYSLMVKQGFGHIVNTASQAGLHAIAGTTSYAVTKHAVVGLSTSLRAEGADLGVKVSVVCPGPVQTNIFNATTMVKADKEKFFSLVPQFMIMDVQKAVKVILHGVARNQAIIVLPFSARFLWWLHRINPAISEYTARQGVKVFRKYRH